jgi:hypothetical protein
MQPIVKNSAQQRAVIGQHSSQDFAVVDGPIPISSDLLQFIGGGKGVAPPPKPTAPNNGW